jgi:hypothetical protein
MAVCVGTTRTTSSGWGNTRLGVRSLAQRAGAGRAQGRGARPAPGVQAEQVPSGPDSPSTQAGALAGPAHSASSPGLHRARPASRHVAAASPPSTGALRSRGWQVSRW